LPSLIRTPLSGQCCKEYAGPQRRIETDKFLGVSAVAFDVAAVRKRFGALQRDDLVFFDGPGGSQVPDEVIDAIASYLRESNANVSGPYETSRRTEALVDESRSVAAGFLGCEPEEVVFGANMTTLNFALTRTLGRELQAGDEIVVTQLDHDGNVSPWLELAHDLGLEVRFTAIGGDTTLDLDDLAAQLSERTRVVAYPWASNAVGTLVDVARVAELAHEAGALAWVDAVHYAPHGPIDVAAAGIDVLLCSPYKYFGPHLGLAFARSELLERWRPYKVRPAADEPLGHRFETGTLPHELLAGFVAAVRYLDSVGLDAVVAYERELGERFLRGLPERCRLYGLPTMEGRVPTFCFDVEGLAAAVVAGRLGERGFAVWHGNYYAVEVMKRLGLPDGAVRAGFLHYNTADEVDGLLTELDNL
jgi:cysteine desulfurase family protein (TIGR01976 family)